jgi:hypothetical protein
MATFDGDDQLGYDRQDLVAALVEQVVGAQDGEGPIGVELLPSSVEEDRQVVVVVQRFHRHLPHQLRQRVLVVHSDRQVAAVVVPAELRSWHLPLLESPRLGDGLLELPLFLESAGSLASDSLGLGVLGQRSGEGELVDGLVGAVLELVLGDVFPGEVSEGTVRVLWSVLVLPWLVRLVALFA